MENLLKDSSHAEDLRKSSVPLVTSPERLTGRTEFNLTVSPIHNFQGLSIGSGQMPKTQRKAIRPKRDRDRSDWIPASSLYEWCYNCILNLRRDPTRTCKYAQGYTACLNCRQARSKCASIPSNGLPLAQEALNIARDIGPRPNHAQDQISRLHTAIHGLRTVVRSQGRPSVQDSSDSSDTALLTYMLAVMMPSIQLSKPIPATISSRAVSTVSRPASPPLSGTTSAAHATPSKDATPFSSTSPVAMAIKWEEDMSDINNISDLAGPIPIQSLLMVGNQQISRNAGLRFRDALRAAQETISQELENN
ncbi:hypothetical protein P175DRAFT_0557173 [Aspergillus ochraceoroseus IBT 24754]|uniref:Uncharacterized protein n=1 Tax=Aspergillus ochraceoroseus IBT 24754 TaxID=1392256 RepID=A0A2T5LW57_9EURO|nr:uncharacterized protein P175DRAFT_0557173 [Aspergillus ochraceoroseus IBT 24754]PTU20483.1 hypothetical protein P175DRAFT_0557173 [Aspergillus ochraceoroseus IBT 24754]